MEDELDSFGKYCFFSTFVGTLYGAVIPSFYIILLVSTLTGLLIGNLYITQSGVKV